MKSSLVRLVLAAAFLLTAVTPAHAQKPGRTFSPEGCPRCVKGPTFEAVRGPIMPSDPNGSEFTQGAVLTGQILTSIDMHYKTQPASMEAFTTQPGFPAETMFMYRQFQPSNRNAWIKVDFGALVSIQPASGEAAGLAYALYVKEDGGDGTITNSGSIVCGGDDACGYLAQTYNAPWLLNCNSQRVWSSVMTSNFFQISGTHLVEVQVHIWPLHEGATTASVVVNNGYMAFTSGKP